MKIVMMGTGPFAVPTFRALLASNHVILSLITRPSKPARGRKLAPHNPMRAVAEGVEIPVIDPEDINAEINLLWLGKQRADLFVVCDYGQILSREALGQSRLGGVNLHGSLLPRYRGAAPINWALWDGVNEAGVTVIHMTPRLDGGPMLVQQALAVGREEDAVSLESRLSELGVSAVLQAVEMLAQWDGTAAIGVPQDPQLATKAPRLRKEQGAIDWHRTAREIFNQVRAFKPWPGSYSNADRPGKEPLRVIMDQVAPIERERFEALLPESISSNPNVTSEVNTSGGNTSGGNTSGGNTPGGNTPGGSAPGGSAPGEIVAIDGRLFVHCCDLPLEILRIQPSGKRVMDAAEFLRGYGPALRFQ